MKLLSFVFVYLFSINVSAQQMDFVPEGIIPFTIFSDSGITGPSYEEIQRSMYELSYVNEQVTLVSIGNTAQGREQTGVLIHNPHVTPTKMILVTGAIHGNEYLGIADRLVGKFANPSIAAFQNYLNSGGTFFVLPIHNADGYEMDRRHNINGKDLNRDFPNPRLNMQGHTQPESYNLSVWVNGFLDTYNVELKLVMDYHCCLGSLLHPIGYSRRDVMPPLDMDEHMKVVTLMYNNFSRGYTYGTPIDTVGYTARGTTLDYWYVTRKALTFTFEGEYGQEHRNLENHSRWFQEIVQLF